VKSSVTFTQALTLAGLFGLMFFISTQAPLGILLTLLAAERIDVPPSAAAPLALLGLSGAIALAPLAVAALRSRTNAGAGDSLTFSQLLFLTGLLGLVDVVLLASPLTILLAWESDPPITGPAVVQAVAFAIPLAVLAVAVAGMRRARRTPEQSADLVTPARLLTCMALLVVMFTVAIAPGTVYSILRYAPDGAARVTGSALVLGVNLAVPIGALALTVWWSRTGAAIGAGRLIAVVALLGLNALAGGGLSPITVVGAFAVLGLLWAGFGGGGADDGVRTLNATQLLAGVGLTGLGFAGIVTPTMLAVVTAGLPASLIVGLGVLLGFFYAVPIAILIAAGYHLRRARTPA